MSAETQTVNLILPMPPSANRYWRVDRRGFTFVSPEAKKYKQAVADMADAGVLIYSEISVTLKVFRPQRSGDLDNKLKCLIDAMQGVVFANDGQIVEIHAYRYEDKHRPRVEVEVKVLGLC